MPRSRAFRPCASDVLEGRVVLSQTYFSPVTGIIQHPTVHVAAVPTHHGNVAFSTVRTKLADGKVETVRTSTPLTGNSVMKTTQITHESDGTTKTLLETSTTSGDTENFTDQITLPDGSHQTETGTNVSAFSTTTVLPDGLLQANPDSEQFVSRTTTFDHVITQAGLGTETIVGTTVAGGGPGAKFISRVPRVTVTNQQVTHFDGSQAAVKILTVEQNGSSTITSTTTPPDGVATTTVSTSKVLARS